MSEIGDMIEDVDPPGRFEAVVNLLEHRVGREYIRALGVSEAYIDRAEAELLEKELMQETRSKFGRAQFSAADLKRMKITRQIKNLGWHL